MNRYQEIEQMDAKLAAIYGTGPQPDADEDLEKRAAAELLVKLAEDQGVDLSQYSDEQVLAAMSELYKTAAEGCDEDKKADGEEKSSEGVPPFFAKKDESGDKETKDESKGGESKEGAGDESRPESGESADDKAGKESSESAEKVAEADFLGRVMAHAMVNEMRQIEKSASAQDAGQEKDAGKLDFLKNLGNKAKGAGKAVGAAAKGQMEKHPFRSSAAVGAATGGAAAAVQKKMSKGKEKKGSADVSALDQLAQQRALAMAKEAGWVDEQGNLIAPPAPQAEEKQASALDIAVEQRALELLESNGFPVEWDE
jgi:hypothetical protein